MTNHPPLPVPSENKTCVNENCKRTGLLARKGGGGQRSANEKPIRWRKSKGKNKKKREFLFFEFARSIFLDRSDALLSLKNITYTFILLFFHSRFDVFVYEYNVLYAYTDHTHTHITNSLFVCLFVCYEQ